MQHPYPTAGAGPYLFNAWTFEGDGCGQHGWWGTVRQLADVRRDSLIPTDTVRYTVADSAAGMNRLIATDWGDPEGVRGMSLRDVEAEFLSDTALTVSLRFLTDAPFAMGRRHLRGPHRDGAGSSSAAVAGAVRPHAAGRATVLAYVTPP
jgi:hypothetical protein